MLTKKSMGPMDCASCDKGVVNLNGMRAEHLSWNRLPFREPNERIAKYGQGFSRFLAATGQANDLIQLRTAHHSNRRGTSSVELSHQQQMPTTSEGRTDGFQSPPQQMKPAAFRTTDSFLHAGSHTELKANKPGANAKMMTLQQESGQKQGGRPMFIDAMLPNVKNISNASTHNQTTYDTIQ